jgi:hypothetical protein
VIRDAFEHRRHFGYRHHKAQIARGGLSQSKNVDALPINFNLQLIDLVVMVKHLARGLAVSLGEGVHGFDQRGFGLAAQTQHAGAQRVKFFIKMPVNFHEIDPNQPNRPVM